jgi:hypothetical protein
MKKQLLIFGLCSLSVLSIAQDKWDTDANILDNNARFGSKNNKGFKIVTDNQTTIDVDNSGKIKFKKKVEFENTFIADSIRVNNYLVADSIKTRILKVGNNSLVLGGFPQPGGDNIQSTNGVINFGNSTPATFPNINISIGSQFAGPFTAARAKLFVNGRTGLNFTNPLSTLGIGGNQSLGAGFAGLNAPVNGLIVEGFTGAGTSNPLRQLDVFTPGNVPQMRVTRFTNTQFTDINVNNSGDYILLPTNTALPIPQRPRFVGIQTNTPGNTLEINSQIANSATPNGGPVAPTFGPPTGASGLRFSDLNNTSIPQNNTSGRVLSLNAAGDVILVPDGGGSGPGGATAKNGLNTTVGFPDVELGGTLIRATTVDQNNFNLVWNGVGRFGIGDNLLVTTLDPTSRIHFNTNTEINTIFTENNTVSNSNTYAGLFLSSGNNTIPNRSNTGLYAEGRFGSTVNTGIEARATSGSPANNTGVTSFATGALTTMAYFGQSFGNPALTITNRGFQS